MLQRPPGEFDTFLFADYSGAENEASQRSAIALFRLDARQKRPKKLPGPFTRVTLREELIAQLVAASRDGRRVLFGIDHQWSWPRDLLALAGLDGLPWRERLRRLVAGGDAFPPLGPASTYARAFNEATATDAFHCRVRSLAAKYGIPETSRWPGNPIRLAETRMPGAKPATRLGGTGAVAGQTLAGLRELHALLDESRRLRIQVRAWPFELLRDDGRSHVGCEIYPGHCRRALDREARALTRPEWSEHDRDAALTCVWASRAPLARLLDLSDAPAAVRRAARIEGWILGAPTSTSHS